MNTLKNTRALGKLLFDRIRNEKLQYNLLQALPFWIASLASGLIAVLYAWLFAKAEELSREILHINLWWILLLTPTCFVAAFFVVEQFSKYARGSGIPQVMAALELPNTASDKKLLKLVGIRVMITKIASSLLMVLGGAAIGREGPTIQIASSVFKKINQWVPESWPKISKRTMIMTGAAAGLAAAFNTPLGGIVFAVEELTRTHIRYYRTAIFSAVIISGLTAQWLLGPYLYLGYPDVRNLSIYIFGGVLLVAILTGLGGSIMCSIMLRLFSWKRNFNKQQQYYYVIGCALIMAVIALFNTHILGSGKDLMNDLLFHADKHQHWYYPILRTIGPILSFTTGAAGGVFAPALSAGASIGGCVAQAFHLTATNSNLLILAGMVGFLTGVTRTPFTSAILVLEMTDRHSVIFYLMFAGMVASLVSILIDKHSFYDHLKHSYIHAVREEDEEEPEINPAADKMPVGTTA
jgi:H+/Cl- antiporter ClcA